MIVSPFTPLDFSRRKSDGIDSRYIQTFATTDRIMFQIIGNSTTAEPDVEVRDITNPDKTSLLFDVKFTSWDINATTKLWFSEMSFSPGVYYVVVKGYGDSRPFRVTDNPLILEKTTLIQYSMNSNRHRKDAVFFINGMQRFFDFRVPGGFKDSNWAFAVEGEQFVTDTSDIVQLYGLDSTQKKFTLGNSDGCPIWFAEMLNRLLCCSYVYFDGKRFARKDTSVPETTVLIDGVNSFVFTQNLQQVINIDPALTQQHLTIMRRVDNTHYRLAKSNINRLIE